MPAGFRVQVVRRSAEHVAADQRGDHMLQAGKISSGGLHIACVVGGFGADRQTRFFQETAWAGVPRLVGPGASSSMFVGAWSQHARPKTRVHGAGKECRTMARGLTPRMAVQFRSSCAGWNRKLRPLPAASCRRLTDGTPMAITGEHSPLLRSTNSARIQESVLFYAAMERHAWDARTRAGHGLLVSGV